MIERLRVAAARRLATARHYPRKRDWALSLYQEMLFRGARWPGRDAVVPVRVHGDPDPLYLRLGGSDWLVLEQVFHKGEYDMVLPALPSAHTIVDLGANIGCTVRLWRRRYPEARILAVEPDAESAAMLRRNTVAHGDRLTEIVEAGVVGTQRPISLRREGGSWNHRLAEDYDPARAVAAVTMDELVSGLRSSEIDLLKCDVEGTERELFESCRSWINRVRVVVVEVHSPFTVGELMSRLADAGGKFELLEASRQGANPLCLLRIARLRHVPSGRSAFVP